MTGENTSTQERLAKFEAPDAVNHGLVQAEVPEDSPMSILKFFAWTICALIFIGLGFVGSQFLITPKPMSAGDVGSSQELIDSKSPAQLAKDPFMKHAAEAGVNECSSVYSVLGQALTNGTDYMVQTQTAKLDANKHSLYGAVGMQFQTAVEGGYKGDAAGIVFVSPVAGGCEGAMVRIVPFTQSCSIAATFLPSRSQALQPLKGLQVYALNNGGQAILMPSAQGCVAISIVRAG